MAGRYATKPKESTPGPANYDLDSSLRKLSMTVRYTIRGRPQEKTRNNQPGPGSYNTETTSKSRNGLKFTTTKRQLLAQTIRECLPGPGAYEYAALLLKSAPKYSFAKKYKRKEVIIPGPGAYNTKAVVGNEGSSAIMCGRRLSTVSSCTLHSPGPASYTPHAIKANVAAFKIGKEPRIKNEVKATPGPGTYNPLSKSFRASTPMWKYDKV